MTWQGHAHPSPVRIRTRNEDGFTLMELLVAVLLFAIVSASMLGLFRSQHRFFETEDAANATQQNTRAALKRLANDVLLVGRGINALSLDNPDVIVPNDGTTPPNTYQDDAVTLLSVPDSVSEIGFAANAAKSATKVVVVDDAGGVAKSVKPGELIIVHDTNLGSSQVLRVTKTTLSGGGVELEFAAGDALLAAYPAASSQMYRLNVVSYRKGVDAAGRTFLERQIDGGAWQRMVSGIQDLRFTYYDAMGKVVTPNSQATRKQIRQVAVAVEGASASPVGPGGQRVRLEMKTLVVPRNMME